MRTSILEGVDAEIMDEEEALISESKREQCKEKPESIAHDALDTINLGIPIFVAMLSWVGMKTTDTALLGHVSASALSAAALSDLWTMCTAVLIQGRVLGVLVGQAVGAGNPKMGGVYLQVSYVVLGVVSIFVMICWFLTEQVWLALGQGPEISERAGYYSRVLAFSIPGLVVFGQLSQFFSAQRIMRPEVTSSLIALALNIILGLIFVLGIPFPNFDGYGFVACPIVTTVVEYIQDFFMYVVFIRIQKLHLECWGGWSLQEITRERIMIFSKLYFPAAFGMASDFWRVAIIGSLAAAMGEDEVGVFNTSYRIMWITLVITMSLASAAGIKLSMRLGTGDHDGAKQAGYVGIALAFAFLVVISIIALTNMRLLGQIFTQDEGFLVMFDQIKVPFTVTLFLMCLSVAIERIPYSMGRTADVFWLGLVASWGAQVPAVFLLTRFWRDDLFALYTGMAVGYFVLVLLYGGMVLTSDWKKYSVSFPVFLATALLYFICVTSSLESGAHDLGLSSSMNRCKGVTSYVPTLSPLTVVIDFRTLHESDQKYKNEAAWGCGLL